MPLHSQLALVKVVKRPWPSQSAISRRKFYKLGVEWHPYYPEVATCWKETLEYWKQCIQRGISARLLLVKTTQTCPLVIVPKVRWRFLGFDIACPGGGWHSAIWDLWLYWKDKHLEVLRGFAGSAKWFLNSRKLNHLAEEKEITKPIGSVMEVSLS